METKKKKETKSFYFDFVLYFFELSTVLPKYEEANTDELPHFEDPPEYENALHVKFYTFFVYRETKFKRALRVHFLAHFTKKLLPLSHTES